MATQRWRELSIYSACDVADALLKLNVPGAGFLADLSPVERIPSLQPKPWLTKVVAPASTFLMVPKATKSFPVPTPVAYSPSNLPEPSMPYSDYTQPDTVVLISQPPNQKCAVVGGIMAARMKKLGAQAIVVDGRVRDLSTLSKMDLPVWSKGTSIIGAGAESKFHAMEVPIKIGAVTVEPGDIIIIDEEEKGVVVVPLIKVDQVLDILPKLVAADEKVMKDVEKGVSVRDAFKKHRT